MKKLHLWFYYLTSFFTFCLVAVSLALVLFHQSEIPQNTLKAILEYQLDNVFACEVEVGQLSGNFLTHVQISDLRLHNHPRYPQEDILSVGEAHLYLNPLAFLYRGGNLLSIARKVVLEDVNLSLVRDADDQWNLLHLPKPSDTPAQSTGSFEMPKITTKVIMNDVYLTYRDEKGWAPTPLAVPFVDVFYFEGADLFFDNENRAIVTLSDGLVGSSKEPIAALGGFDIENGRFDISFSAHLNMDRWGHYVLPVENFELYSGVSRIRGRLRSKNPIDFSVLPFWYTLGIDLRDATFELPMIEQPITNINGTIVLSEGMIPKSYLGEKITDLTADRSDRIWDAMVDTGFLDKEGHVLHTFRGSGMILGLPKEVGRFKSDITDILKQPPSRLYLDGVTATLAGMPLTAHGFVGLSSQKLELMVRGRAFELTGIQRLFPAISNWKLSGLGDTDLMLKGPFENVDITGTLQSSTAQFYSFQPSSFWLDYAFDGEVLSLVSDFSTLYDGELSLAGQVDFRPTVPTLDLSLRGSGMSIQSVFPRSDVVTGNFGFYATMLGDTIGYDAQLLLYPQELHIFNQQISMAHTTFFVTGNEDVVDLTGSVLLNGGGNPLKISGRIDNMVSANLTVSGEGVWARDVMGGPSHNFGLATMGVSINADLVSAFWDKPLSQSRFDFEGDLVGYPFENRQFDTVSFKGSLNKNTLNVDTFHAQNDRESATVSGEFISFVPVDVSLSLDRLSISHSKLFQRIMPTALLPIGGRLTAEAQVAHLTDSPTASRAVSGDSTLKTVGVSGQFKLTDGYIKNQPIEALSLDLMWDGRRVSFDDLSLRQGESRVSMDGHIALESGVSLSISEGSTVMFDDFKLWTSPYGDFHGRANVSGRVGGTAAAPDIQLAIVLTDFSTPYLTVDELSGNLLFVNNQLELNAWKIREKSNFLSLDGRLDVTPFRSPEKLVVSDLVYDVNLAVESAELGMLIYLAEGIHQDIVQRLSAGSAHWQDKRSISQQADQDIYRLRSVVSAQKKGVKKVSLFSGEEVGESLSFYETILARYEQLSEQGATSLKKLLKGQLSGYFRAQSRPKENPLVDVNIKLKNGQFWFLNMDQLNLVLMTQNDEIAYDMRMIDGGISGIPFEYVQSGGLFDEAGFLTIKETEIKSNGKVNSQLLSGTFPLQAYWDNRLLTRPMSLKAYLDGNNIAILSFLNRDIRRLFNRGSIALTVTGPLTNPVLNASDIDLTGAGLQFDSDVMITSPMLYQSGAVTLRNNRLNLDGLRLSWAGNDTLDKRNTLDVSGGIFIRGLSFIQPDMVRIGLDLAIKDTDLSLNISDVYRGNISTSKVQIRGDYLVGLSRERQSELAKTIATRHEQGPLVSGHLQFENGDLSIPKVGAKKVKPSLLLNLQMSVGENVSVVGGILGDNLLAGLANYLDIRLQGTDSPLLISGSLNAPKLDNSLILAEGSMTFLNRGFELLSTDEQSIFFQDNQFKIQPHRISFQQDTLSDGTLRLNPQLRMSAYSVIESLATENVVHDGVVMQVNGSIYNLDEIVFEKYKMTTIVPQRGDPEYVKSLQFSTDGSESDQSRETYEVLSLLVPELVGAQLDDSQGTQGLLEVVGENQINSYLRRRVLRPIERQIAKNVGLYDLRVDYNVGRALIRGTSEDEADSSDTDSIGVAFVKGLSHNLFLKVRTNLELQTTNTNSLENSNIELQYNLLKNLSLSYSNGRERHEVETNPKFSLRYSHEF